MTELMRRSASGAQAEGAASPAAWVDGGPAETESARGVDASAEGRSEPTPNAVGSVLFACTHNAIRSPMAQALLADMAGGRIYSSSVGVMSDLPVDGFAVAVMEEIGLDLTRHSPHTFQDLVEWGEDIDAFDMIVALSPAAQRHALEHVRGYAVDVEYWPVVDPTAVEGSREQRLEAYREVRDTLERRIRLRFGARRAPVG